MLRVLERNDMNGMSKEKLFFAKSADSDDKEEEEEEEEEEPASKKPRRSGQMTRMTRMCTPRPRSGKQVHR
jgi:hypothetical protein